MRKVLFFTLLLGIVPAADAGLPAVYSGAEIKGRILDAKTGEAIEGAVIVASWHLYQPQWHSPDISLFYATEGVSDKDGNYTVPRWGPIHRPGGWQMDGGQDPVIYIFKPGYEVEARGNATWRTGVQTGPPFNSRSASVRRSAHDGKEIVLYKLGTKPRKRYVVDPRVKRLPLEERTIKAFASHLRSIVPLSAKPEETINHIRQALILADKELTRISKRKHFWDPDIEEFLKGERQKVNQ